MAIIEINEKAYWWLVLRSRLLTALENAGVDNWEGYDAAMRTLKDYDQGEDEGDE